MAGEQHYALCVKDEPGGRIGKDGLTLQWIYSGRRAPPPYVR